MAHAQSPDVADDRCGMAGRSRGAWSQDRAARTRIDTGRIRGAVSDPIGTLRDWEQGRVEPDQAAQAYLKAIAGDAAAVQRAILLRRITCVAQPILLILQLRARYGLSAPTVALTGPPIVMAGLGQGLARPSTSFLHANSKDVDGCARKLASSSRWKSGPGKV